MYLQQGREKRMETAGEVEAALPALHPRKAPAYFISLGWAGCGAVRRAWVFLPPRSYTGPAQGPSLPGLGRPRGPGSRAPGFRRL